MYTKQSWVDLARSEIAMLINILTNIGDATRLDDMTKAALRSYATVAKGK